MPASAVGRPIRGLAVAALATVATLAGAPVAVADAITYTDGGNVWVASPDGSVKKQLTTTATSATEGTRYFGPSQADDGRIAVIFGGGLGKSSSPMIQVLDPNGKLERSGLLQLSTCGAFGQFPSAFAYTRIDSAGSAIAYNYICTNTQAGGGTNLYTALTPAANPGGTGDPLQLTGIWYPSWLPSQAPGAAAPDMIATSQGLSEIGKLVWVTPPLPSLEPVLVPQGDDSLVAASVSKTGNILAYSVRTEGEARELYMAKLAGPFGPGVAKQGECLVTRTDAPLVPSVSPDGKRVAWDDQGGAKVAAVNIPAGSTGGPCGATATTISATGINPVFSGAAAPGNGDGPGPGPSPTPGPPANTLTVKWPSKATRAQIRKGLRFTTRCSKKCTVKGQMSAKGKTVARATKKLKRKGTAKLVLKARLAASVREVTVVVSSAGKSATRTIPVSR